MVLFCHQEKTADTTTQKFRASLFKGLRGQGAAPLVGSKGKALGEVWSKAPILKKGLQFEKGYGIIALAVRTSAVFVRCAAYSVIRLTEEKKPKEDF